MDSTSSIVAVTMSSTPSILASTMDSKELTRSINDFLQALEYEGWELQGHPPPPSTTPSRSVDDSFQSCLAAEYTLRRLFATDPEDPLVKSPYVGLFDIFDLSIQTRLARPRDRNEPEFIWRHQGKDHSFPEKYILPARAHLQRTSGAPCTVADLPTFRAAWDVFSGGALSAITNWDNIIVAGGSVLACLTHFGSNPSRKELFNIYQSATYKGSDIDLFLWGMDEETAKKKMQDIFDVINFSLPWDAVCFRTKNVITIQAEYPKRPIQIIMRLYKSPAEILCGFDVDCCCVAYNGTNIFTIPRGLRAIIRQCNTINLSRRSPSYEHRLAKYSARGYEIFYPCLERNSIDYKRLADPERSVFPKGLGRLIVNEIMAANLLYFPNLYDHEDSDGYIRAPASPVPIERLRPSNYDYAWCRIPYGPKWWDVQMVKKHIEKVGQEIIEAISERQGALVHHHVITCGTMSECLEHCCDSTVHQPHTQDLGNGLFRGPAEFIIDDPGRQTVGSFNPTNYGRWESEAYIDLDH